MHDLRPAPKGLAAGLARLAGLAPGLAPCLVIAALNPVVLALLAGIAIEAVIGRPD